jgi:hypothetical protein
MSALIATLGGLVAIGIAARDVFHQLFHPQGSGSISQLVGNLMWRLFRRIGRHRRGVLSLVGPVIVVTVIVMWTASMVVGWALLYWPRLPAEYRLASGLTRQAEQDFGVAVYLSGVTLTTVGYGEMTPLSRGMRAASMVEGAVGFGLLTASISWVLSLYPVLQRRRAAALHLWLLTSEGNALTEPAAAWEVAKRLIDLRVDLVQFPTAYYFADEAEEHSLPLALQRLERSLGKELAADPMDHSTRLVAAALRALTAQLEAHPALRAASGETLDAYVADHLLTQAEPR